jgi:hypothetical protein
MVKSKKSCRPSQIRSDQRVLPSADVAPVCGKTSTYFVIVDIVEREAADAVLDLKL